MLLKLTCRQGYHVFNIPAILLDFPDHFETERLLLRAPRPGDGQPLNDAIRESLDNLRPWMHWAQMLQTVEQTEAVVRQAAARFYLREELRLHLFRKSDGLLVGSSGMHHLDWSVPRFEIGYWVRASLEGQGYVTEAVNGITRFAFETLMAQRMEILCDVNNTRSAAVAERCGYRLEARLRRDSRAPDGSIRDTLVFARLAGE
jgi:RimJ/RimL family protein N-acetyltransferase